MVIPFVRSKYVNANLLDFGEIFLHRPGHHRCLACADPSFDFIRTLTYGKFPAGLLPSDKSYRINFVRGASSAVFTFYFAHLSPSDQRLFVALHNENRLNLRQPFTVLPFFCAWAETT